MPQVTPARSARPRPTWRSGRCTSRRPTSSTLPANTWPSSSARVSCSPLPASPARADLHYIIAEATSRTREAAEQFAHDSKSEIGGIRQASQGVFEMLPHDQVPGISEESQILKTVRVVSTIDYTLR